MVSLNSMNSLVDVRKVGTESNRVFVMANETVDLSPNQHASKLKIQQSYWNFVDFAIV